MARAPEGGRDAGSCRLGVAADGTLGDPDTYGFIDLDLAMM